MKDRQIARELSNILQATGRLEGQVLAMRDLFVREFGEDYFSEDFLKGFGGSIKAIRYSVEQLYGAIPDSPHGEPVELPPREDP